MNSTARIIKIIWSLSLILTLLSLCIFMSECEEEKVQPRVYPRINTLPVSNISEEGATFNAYLYELGNEEILECGFVWGKFASVKYENNDRVLLAIPEKEGYFSAEIRSALAEGVKYTVIPFIRTEEHMVYGKSVTFTSLGSMAPVITDFEPDSAGWGDTLVIYGRNFSWIPVNNIVKLNQVQSMAISSTDTTIVIKIDQTMSDYESTLSVELAGNVSVFGQRKFYLVMPRISGILPEKASWGDTISIFGKHFSPVITSVSGTIGNYNSNIIAVKADSIFMVVPDQLVTETNPVKIKFFNLEVSSPRDLFLNLPLITAIYPEKGCWGDTIMISGKNLCTDYTNKNISLMLNGVQCNINSKKPDKLSIVISENVITVQNPVSLNSNGHTFTFPLQFTLTPPPLYISKIKPVEGTWEIPVTLIGKFLPELSKNKISFGGFAASIVSGNSDSLIVTAPGGLSFHNNQVVNTIQPFTFVSPDTFKLFAPVIDSIAPLYGCGDQSVTIYGKYLDCNSEPYTTTKVYFGSAESNTFHGSSTKIWGGVPLGMNNGPVSITVKVREQTNLFNKDFIVANPVITDAYPLSGTFDDEITLEGDYLTSDLYPTKVEFGNIAATVVSSTSKKVIARVPASLDSIPRKLSVFWLYIGKGYSTQYFTLSPPEITNISPATLIPGQDIVISGKNFNPTATANKVYWGRYPLAVKSAISTQIVATVPVSLPTGTNKISIKVGGYKRSYPYFYEIQSAWTEIPLPSTLSWWSTSEIGKNGIAFSVKGLGYMMDYSNTRMTSYDPVNNQFTDLGQHTQFFNKGGMSYTVLRDTLYLIGGSSGFNRYDVETNKWISIVQSPSSLSYGILFSLNGKIYHGLNYGNSILEKKFWVYDSGMKRWTVKGDFPGFSSLYPVAYFTIGNRGYVLFADKVFCEYNPDTDSWRKLAQFPGSGTSRFGMVSFVVGDKAYAGLGRHTESASYQYDDLWVYDLVNDVWSEKSHIPFGGRYNSISFVINNNPYIGFGHQESWYFSVNDLFRFYPDFITK